MRNIKPWFEHAQDGEQLRRLAKRIVMGLTLNPPHTNPARHGVYYTITTFTLDAPSKGFRYWNGEFWSCAATNLFAINAVRDDKTEEENIFWGGISKAQHNKLIAKSPNDIFEVGERLYMNKGISFNSRALRK
jgi:hypothetical protein